MKYISKIISLLLVIIMILSLSVSVFATEADSNDVAQTDSAESTVFDIVPLYNQKDYPITPYGEYGTVSTHGCGLVCLAMVATYLHDQEYSIEELAVQFGSYNTKVGSKWILFEDSAKELNLDLRERTRSWDSAKAALQNGQVVISLQNENGYFTDGGHFIVLTGINENNRITVNDPYGGNYTKNWIMVDGFANGFEEHYITCGGSVYWIYGKKKPANFVEREGYVDIIPQNERLYREIRGIIQDAVAK